MLNILYVIAFLSLAACDGLTPGDNAQQKSSGPEDGAGKEAYLVRAEEAQSKWDELATALKISNNRVDVTPEEIAELDAKGLSARERASALEALIATKYRTVLAQPSAYLTDKNLKDEYRRLVTGIAERFAAKAPASRCAAVVGWSPAKLVQPSANVTVYELRYTLGGDADLIRTGLVSVPKHENPKKSFPLLGFAHGDDQGLSYTSMEGNLDGLIESHIVVAPSFPGEPVCAGHSGARDIETGEPNLGCASPEEVIAPAVGISSPWDNDVDELLGMYDCVVKTSVGHYKHDALLPVFVPFAIDQKEKAAELLAATLQGRVQKAMGFGKNGMPLGSLAGASRGGLVAALALAKAGSHWYHIGRSASEHEKHLAAKKEQAKKAGQNPADEPPFKASLLSYLTKPFSVLENFDKAGEEERKTYEEYFAFIENHLGKGYGILSPGSFQGLVMLASPTSVTAGRMRLQLEQMVKGNGDLTRGMFLPGLRQLSSTFDDFRAGRESAEEASLRILTRDAAFLSPLMFASLKRWHKQGKIAAKAPRGSFPNQMRENGSILLIHHEEDEVVPFDQMRFAANIFVGFAADGFIRTSTMSPGGVDIVVRPLHSHPKETENLGGFHLGPAFFAASHVHARADLISNEVIMRAYKKTHFYDDLGATDASAGTPDGKASPASSAASLAKSDVIAAIDKAVLAGLHADLQKAAAHLYGGSGFVSEAPEQLVKAIKALASTLGSEGNSLQNERLLELLRFHALGGLKLEPGLSLHKGRFVSDERPSSIMESWAKTLY